MRLIPLILLTMNAWASCPLYTYPENKKLDQEINNTCENILNPVSNTITANSLVINGSSQLGPGTLSKLKATIPTAAGQLYYCSDCSTDAICVSTGTGRGSFTRLSARTTACN